MINTSREESVYNPTQDNLIFPTKPEFSSTEEERQHRKARLAAACRFFADKGFGVGFGGHLTVRDPEHEGLFWTNPVCIPFGQVRKSMLILVDHKGQVIEGDYAINRAGYVLHSAVHEMNPDIVASCHAHALNSGAWASMGREIEPISQDACIFYGDHTVLAEGSGKVPVGSDSGRAIAEAFMANKIVIHQNHGLLAASRDSIDSAAFWFYLFDRVCKMQMLSESLSTKPIHVSAENATYTQKHLGTEYIAWLNFQCEFAEIQKRHPDFNL
ncbi:class II aldolase/adducin family protein [Kineobactrum salinum]|uniref:Class II aldolase/adducin family protein n=1 Tax=Kineobactrum salinum TaxID=2708301 RepID=A0A6C0U8N2_9GAMM|nr:class II aldolase/adducin family protein [Kineobactrum salinum]QIB66895.1 class II aldolase/adducin family protein [Kineobactrum salinum]